jgi:hypothetical protein
MSLRRTALSFLLSSVAMVCLSQGAMSAMPPPQARLIDNQRQPISADPEESRNIESGRLQTGNPLWAIPLNLLSATRDRPLFSPSRRPPAAAVVASPPAPPAAPPPAAPEQLQLRLVGTIVGTKQHMGVFIDQATQAVVRLQVGEGISGWTLRVVQARAAMFEKDRRETTLELPSRNGSNAPQQEALANSAPSPPAPQPAAQVPAQTGPADGRGATTGTWRDGDGQLIGPPPAPVANAADTAAAAKVDGGVVAPPLSYRAGADGASPPPQAANWRDGDGQLVQQPAAVLRHGAGTWIDGDGQFVPPPLR